MTPYPLNDVTYPLDDVMYPVGMGLNGRRPDHFGSAADDVLPRVVTWILGLGLGLRLG